MILKNKYFKYTLWILLITLIIFYGRQLSFLINFSKTILMFTILPTLFASLFYYLLRPLLRFLVKHNINKTLAIVGIFLIIIALISISTIFAGKIILSEFSSFYDTILKNFKQVPETVRNLLDQSGFSNFSYKDIENNFLGSLDSVFNSLRENMLNWITNITNIGTTLILIPIITFFLLKDDKLLYKNIKNVIPSKYTVRATNIIKEIDCLLHNYFFGQLIVAGFLGIITYFGYLIIGLPNALLLAVISMILSIIPFLGPAMGVIPAIILAWTINPFMVLKVILVLIVTQQLEGNLIRPKIIGDELEIHPMMIIFLVIIAVALYGFVGAFFAIPVYGVLRIIAKNLIKHIQVKKDANKHPEL